MSASLSQNGSRIVLMQRCVAAVLIVAIACVGYCVFPTAKADWLLVLGAWVVISLVTLWLAEWKCWLPSTQSQVSIPAQFPRLSYGKGRAVKGDMHYRWQYRLQYEDSYRKRERPANTTA